MTRRGHGIGIEVTGAHVRAVRFADGGPDAGLTATAEIPSSPRAEPASPADQRMEFAEQLLQVSARVGTDAATRIAWFPSGSTLQAVDVTDADQDAVAVRRQQLVEGGATATAAIARGGSPSRLLGLRWDIEAAAGLVGIARAVGFAEPEIEPSPVALARIAPRGMCAAEVGDGWSTLIVDRAPLLAATNAPVTRRHETTTLLLAEVDPQILREHRHRLDTQLDHTELARLLATVAAAGTPLRSRWSAGASRAHGPGATGRAAPGVLRGSPPPPPPPPPDVTPYAVALGAAVGAARLAPEPLIRIRCASDTSSARDVDERAWVVERLAEPPPPPRPPAWRHRLRALAKRRSGDGPTPPTSTSHARQERRRRVLH